MALAAAEAALDDNALWNALARGGFRLRQIERGCKKLDWNSCRRVVNFMLIKTAWPRVCKALEREKVIVRPVDGYGLPDYIRVTVGTRAENTHFLKALERVLKQL